jgi:hypothetical protein
VTKSWHSSCFLWRCVTFVTNFTWTPPESFPWNPNNILMPADLRAQPPGFPPSFLFGGGAPPPLSHSVPVFWHTTVVAPAALPCAPCSFLPSGGGDRPSVASFGNLSPSGGIVPLPSRVPLSRVLHRYPCAPACSCTHCFFGICSQSYIVVKLSKVFRTSAVPLSAYWPDHSRSHNPSRRPRISCCYNTCTTSTLLAIIVVLQLKDVSQYHSD